MPTIEEIYRAKLIPGITQTNFNTAYLEYLRDKFLQINDSEVFKYLQTSVLIPVYSKLVIDYYVNHSIPLSVFNNRRLSECGRKYYDILSSLGLTSGSWDVLWVVPYNTGTRVTEKSLLTGKTLEEIAEICLTDIRPIVRDFIRDFHIKYVPSLSNPEVYADGIL